MVKLALPLILVGAPLPFIFMQGEQLLGSCPRLSNFL
jgi:hypothetical protein